jgi:hypothetical protein
MKITLSSSVITQPDLSACSALTLLAMVCIAAAAAAAAAAAVRQLEAWTKGELLGLTSKVKAVLAGCTAHQQQVNLQVCAANRWLGDDLGGSCQRRGCQQGAGAKAIPR